MQLLPPSVANIVEELTVLSQQRSTGELILSSGDEQWHLYLLLGNLLYATGGNHRVRRWHRAVKQYCPGFQYDVYPLSKHKPWECDLLYQGINQNHLSLTQAKSIIGNSVHEVLFALVSHSELITLWCPRKQRPIALLEVEKSLQTAQQLWQQWQELGLEQLCPDKAPIFKQPLIEQNLGTDEIPLSLRQLIDGTHTIWDIALQVKQPVTAVAIALQQLTVKSLIELQTIPDFPAPLERGRGKAGEAEIQGEFHPLIRPPLNLLTTDELALQIREASSLAFTGRLDVEDTQVQEWSLYFRQGDLIGCASSVHPIRRWCRQLSQYCPQLAVDAVGLGSDQPQCWDYDCSSELVRQGKVLQGEMAAVVEGLITEIMFDIYQQSERLRYRKESQLTYKRIPQDTIDLTDSTLVSIRADVAWQQAMQAWEAWQRAGLVDYSPNLAPVILQPEELQRQTSPQTYQNLIALADGSLTLRDLALKLKQNLLPLAQSIMPYIHQGLIGLTEIGDLSCAVKPATALPVTQVPSHLQLKEEVTSSAVLRQELGDFSSIVCLKAVIVGMKEALGERVSAIVLIGAGRTRGRKLAEDLGLVGGAVSLAEATDKITNALGKDGTRLCVIEKIVPEAEVIKVYTSETLCSAGEPQGSSRKCTYTLGAVWGALERILGKRLHGKHTESVLRGGSHDVFEFTILP